MSPCLIDHSFDYSIIFLIRFVFDLFRLNFTQNVSHVVDIRVSVQMKNKALNLADGYHLHRTPLADLSYLGIFVFLDILSKLF